MDERRTRMNEDAIDRKLVCAFIDGLISDDGERKKGLEYIRNMPPVNPTKTGHWIWCFDSHKCSNCEKYTCFSRKELLKYCPNCGAKMIEPQKSEDAIEFSEEDAIKMLKSKMDGHTDTSYEWAETVRMSIKALEQEQKTGRCKDCKWRKDSDGSYQRGVRAESKCPINRKEVLEGNGYCYMFEPQERSDKE
jgi:predicted  nucleic acid-binding Zn-ribbon protein